MISMGKREIDYDSTKNDLLRAILNMQWTDDLQQAVIKEIW